MTLGLAQRMKMPLFASSLAQNSARIMKSLYEFLETRKPLSLPAFLSAWIAPSAAFQFELPTAVKFSMPLVPSISVVQPLSHGMLGIESQPASATTKAAAAIAETRFMGAPPFGWVGCCRTRMALLRRTRQAMGSWPHEVALAELDPVVAHDVVGGGAVEHEVRHRALEQELEALVVQLAVAHLDRDRLLLG